MDLFLLMMLFFSVPNKHQDTLDGFYPLCFFFKEGPRIFHGSSNCLKGFWLVKVLGLTKLESGQCPQIHQGTMCRFRRVFFTLFLLEGRCILKQQLENVARAILIVSYYHLVESPSKIVAPRLQKPFLRSVILLSRKVSCNIQLCAGKK